MARYTVIIDDDGNEVLYDLQGDRPGMERVVETLFSIAITVQTELSQSVGQGVSSRG
jgi:hypothetical protein